MNESAASVETVREELKTDGSMAKLWLKAIKAADAEEKGWRQDADESVEVYRGEASHGTNFNIHHSNIETISPSIYNSLPIPDIRPRFPDQRAEPAMQPPMMQPGMPAPPMQPPPAQETPAKQVSVALERMLTIGMDTYDFDAEIKAVVNDALLPGRGVARVRYEPHLSPDGASVAAEDVRTEHVPWKRFRRGSATIWRDVPWVAFELFLSRDELKRLSPKHSEDVQLDCSTMHGDDDKAKPEESDIFKRARVWEIWDKATRTVYFVAASFTDDVLHAVEDPLGLEGFFPCPRPIYALQSGQSLIPLAPYKFYRSLSDELNELTTRITALVKMIRVKGAYAASSEEVRKLVDADDGELVAAVSAMGTNLNQALSWWPIEPQAKALAQLVAQREAVKQTIYEVTGISDIVRGASKSSETATAQQIKQQWGSLRIQRMQTEVQRFIRDLFRMTAEIIAERFDPATIARVSKVDLSPEAIALMRDDKLRGYSIDVESDSTIRSDLTRNQETMTNFVQATAGYIQAVGPAVQAGMMPGDVAVSIYAAFARNFNLGREVDMALSQLADAAKAKASQPQQAPPDPKMIEAQERLKHDKARLEMESQERQARLEMDRQAALAKMEFEREKHAAEMQLKAAELAARQEEKIMERDMEAARFVTEQERENHRFAMEREAGDFDRGLALDRADMAREKTREDIELRKRAARAKAGRKPAN